MDRGVGHDGRVLDEAFDAAQALGEGKQPHAFEEALGAREIAIELDADHAAKGVHLPLGDGVLRMAFEAGIDDVPNFRPRLQPAGDGKAVLRMPLHPQRQRL